jgi:hypothetical protein
VVQRSGGGDHHVRQVVPTPVEAVDLRPGQALDALDAADDVAADRRVAPERRGEGVVHDVTGVVVVHGDLLEDHAPLDLDVVGGEQRVGH